MSLRDAGAPPVPPQGRTSTQRYPEVVIPTEASSGSFAGDVLETLREDGYELKMTVDANETRAYEVRPAGDSDGD